MFRTNSTVVDEVDSSISSTIVTFMEPNAGRVLVRSSTLNASSDLSTSSSVQNGNASEDTDEEEGEIVDNIDDRSSSTFMEGEKEGRSQDSRNIDHIIDCERPTWIFTKDFIKHQTPSRKAGIGYDQELYYRQHASFIIQGIGEGLRVSQLCINTAIIFMQRFFMCHPFSIFHRVPISISSLFLSSKVEEQPTSLEFIVKVSQYVLTTKKLETDSDEYKLWAREIIQNENILLPTLGFDLTIEHPHAQVVMICDLVQANRSVAKTAYHMATSSVHLTTMCLQYKPRVVGCVCMNVAARRHHWVIPDKNDKKWFWYVDKELTQDLLEEYTNEFLATYNVAPVSFKQKIYGIAYPPRSATTSPSSGSEPSSTPSQS